MPANGRFIKDVTIPDDTPMTMGESFVKTWIVQNNGSVAWGNGYAFVHVKGEPMTSVTRVPLPPAAPGQEVQISLQLTAPNKPGTQFSDWRFQDDKGNIFGEIIYLRIYCKAATPEITPASTAAGAVSAPTTTARVNNSYFVADVTVPDDSPVQPGAAFTKTWRVKNSGTTAWDAGHTLAFVGGTAMTSATSLPLPPLAPGAEGNISVGLTAPTTPGRYNGDWQMRDGSGQPFGAKLWLQIVVPGQPAAPVTAPAQTLAPHLSQRDPRWSNIPLANMGGAPSIGRWGCLMTCLTMTANAYGHSVTPDQFNLEMVRKGGFVNGYFTRWEALNVVYPDITFEGKVEQTPDLVSRIDAYLNARRPVTALVDLTPDTAYSDNDQHWVLVVARSGEDYLILDPYTLTPEPISLMARYGRPGAALGSAVRSGLFYKK